TPRMRPLWGRDLDPVAPRGRHQADPQRFYTEVLGLTVDHVNEPIKLIHLRCGRHMIDLLPLGPGEPPPATARVDHVCLAIRCDDLAAAASFLRAHGGAVEGEGVSRRDAIWRSTP